MAKRLHSVEQSFIDTVEEYNLIEDGDVIVVGVSGGPDSITLLTCLNKYKNKFNCEIVVAHINHLIRNDSTEDEQFVENLCKDLNIEFFVLRKNIEKLAAEKKKSVEEMGRIVRYKFFDEVAKKIGANKIAIAHNMNDNAETLLLNLIRGSGMDGLEGIKPFEYNKYIRPLINCKREYIEDYCEENKLKPRIDSTNFENKYMRNNIRNRIIPMLKEINPNVIQSLSRTSEIISENNSFINMEAKKEFERITEIKNDKIEIELKGLNDSSVAIKSKIVLIAIEKLQGDTKNIEKTNIDDVLKMAERNIGKKYILLNKKIKATIVNSKLIIERIP